MFSIDKPDLLINILLDNKASVAERDDAAVDLSDFPTQKVISALLIAAQDPNEDELLAASSGEALGLIWSKLNQFDLNVLNSLSVVAYHEAYAVIRNNKPDWIKLYKTSQDE